MKDGFIKVAAVTPKIRVADPEYNRKKIMEKIEEAEKERAVVVVFPELCITGYTCGDLFFQEPLLEEAQEVCRRLCAAGCGRVIATRGSAGALYYDGADFFRQPPDPVEPVDTLGAGDSFATAFLLSFLESLERAGERMAADRPLYEEEVRAALRRGAAFAAKTCLVQGAFGHGKAFLPE